MGLIARTFRGIAAIKAPAFSPVPVWQGGVPQPMQINYEAFAREGYGGNEIVYAAIEEISSSASEPKMKVRKGKEWLHESKILDLMERPNPFLDRYSFWATVLMYYMISGNAYALKIRSRSGQVVEMWLLRPDRVRIVPASGMGFIERYDFQVGGGEPVPLPAADVIHWKKRNPLNDFYGMSPLSVIAPRIDTDNFLKEFVKSYFLHAGVPGGILSVKQTLSQQAKDDIRARFRNTFSGQGNWHELLVLDNAEATFTATTSQMGQRGLVVPELDEINEARLAMPFGVPLSIIGARLGMASSSYGNRKSDREGFWDETLSPLYQELAGPLNLSLVPEFAGIDEIGFDLADVRALQEDVDKVHNRIRLDLTAGLMGHGEARLAIGLPAAVPAGDVLLIPSNMNQTPEESLGEDPNPTTPGYIPQPAEDKPPVAVPSRNGNGSKP